MNRRSFFGLLGKLAAVAASVKVLPFKVPLAMDVVVFDGPSNRAVTWYGGNTCNWSFGKNWDNDSPWADPNNWSGA